MTKAAGEHRHGKPESTAPERPFRKRKNLPLAAVVTAAILASPGAAKAGTVSAAGHFHKPSTSEKSSRDSGHIDIARPDFSQSINGDYPFNGGTATIEYTEMSPGTLDAEYRILFAVEGERYFPRFRFRAPPPNSLGSAVGVFVSELRTIILTKNYLVVTQGYNDSFRNPDTLLMRDGSRLEKNSFHVRLPQELRGGDIYSCAATFTKDGDISTLFALGGGKLWSFRPDVQDGSPISTDVSASNISSLYSYKGYVFLFQPDSTENFVSIFRRDLDGISSIGTFRAERSDSAQASEPSAREVPGGMMFSSGNRTLIVLFNESTGTFTTAASASD